MNLSLFCSGLETEMGAPAGLCQELVTWNEFHGGFERAQMGGVEPSNIGISP